MWRYFDFSRGGNFSDDDSDYQPPFRFTGILDKLTIKPEPLHAGEEKLLQQKTQEAINAAQ